jgi:uncharacterized membrane protein YfhO
MSDGWGDASGIEGNYADDEDDEKKSDETSETNASNSTNETNSTTEVTETSSGHSVTNVKEEWNGRTIYVPDDVLDALENTYLETQLTLRKADINRFKKNRHFYPVLVQFGLEALANADADEIQARLSELDGISLDETNE